MLQCMSVCMCVLGTYLYMHALKMCTSTCVFMHNLNVKNLPGGPEGPTGPDGPIGPV